MPTPPLPKKSGDQLRKEFFDALARDRAEHKARIRAEAEAREKSAAEHDARLRKEAEEREKSAAEFDRQMAAIRSDFGGFTTNEGKILEGDTIHTLDGLKTLGDLQVTGVLSSMRASKKKREYDGALQCSDGVVLLEIKRHFAVGDVHKFVAEQMRDFPKDFPRIVKGGPLYGAIVASLLDKDARALAEKEGIFVLHVGTNRRVKVVSASAVPRPTSRKSALRRTANGSSRHARDNS